MVFIQRLIHSHQPSCRPTWSLHRSWRRCWRRCTVALLLCRLALVHRCHLLRTGPLELLHPLEHFVLCSHALLGSPSDSRIVSCPWTDHFRFRSCTQTIRLRPDTPGPRPDISFVILRPLLSAAAAAPLTGGLLLGSRSLPRLSRFLADSFQRL